VPDDFGSDALGNSRFPGRKCGATWQWDTGLAIGGHAIPAIPLPDIPTLPFPRLFLFPGDAEQFRFYQPGAPSTPRVVAPTSTDQNTNLFTGHGQTQHEGFGQQGIGQYRNWRARSQPEIRITQAQQPAAPQVRPQAPVLHPSIEWDPFAARAGSRRRTPPEIGGIFVPRRPISGRTALTAIDLTDEDDAEHAQRHRRS
jgi:hypothetical protein